jgi:flagellar hook-length control protein FliK
MVNEIKKILSGLNAKNVSPDIKPLNAGTTLMSFINQILEEIRTLLESQEKPDKSLSIDTVKKQLERLAGQIKAAGALNNSDKVEGSRNQTDKDYTDDEKGLNSPQSKVTVIDKRTIVDKASTMNDGVSKNKKGEITEGQPSIKIKTIGVKDENANSLKLIEKDISDKAHAKETSSIINNKAEAAAQSGKTIPPYTLSANRAGLEALLQNISGRALITLRNGKSELRMTLFPPELGRMNMKFTLEEGRMTAQIVVNTPEAKMIFDQNLGDLQRALQQAGINIGNLNVNLSGHDLDRNDSPSAMETSDKTGFENQGNEIVDDINGSYHSLYESRINYLA